MTDSNTRQIQKKDLYLINMHSNDNYAEQNNVKC